ncbi:MAG: hypothetical protein HRT47_11890 [Candidatus Caenarcaniphilales bacterium]|nr:hypothetical protein [Candidatus Caenarcaniphilales bacterium]
MVKLNLNINKILPPVAVLSTLSGVITGSIAEQYLPKCNESGINPENKIERLHQKPCMPEGSKGTLPIGATGLLFSSGANLLNKKKKEETLLEKQVNSALKKGNKDEVIKLYKQAPELIREYIKYLEINILNNEFSSEEVDILMGNIETIKEIIEQSNDKKSH